MKNNVNRELNDIARDFQASQMRANELYNAIGRAYFNKAKGNPDEEFMQMFSDLETVLRQQEQMETRRKFLNGIVVCTNCKADNTVELSFCGCCGSRLPHKMAPVDDGRIRCVNCGNILQPGQAFCGNCGTKAPVQEATPAPVAAAPAEPVAAPEPPVATAVVEPVVVPAAEKPAEVVSETMVVEAPAEVVETPAEAVAEPAAEVSEEPVNEAPAAEEIAATETPVAEAPKEEFYSSPEEFKVFCGNCGTMITNKDAVFCPNCGNRIVK